jgi:cytidylate kinase
MNHPTSSERLAEAMGRARRRWQADRNAEDVSKEDVPKEPLPPKPALFTIALSRQAGARGTSVARVLGARLGWKVYDHELLQRIAQGMGQEASLLESMDEKKKSWLQECWEALAARPLASKEAYIRRLVETLLSLGVQGECVIVGRGAAQLLPAATTLRVRLVASREERITSKSQNLGISREEAASRIDRTDWERITFVRDHFHCDAADPSTYDLVLNTARFSLVDCADIIIAALHRLQTRVPAETAAVSCP